MPPNCTVKDEFTAPLICCSGGKGTVLGADRPIPSDWSTGTTGFIYLLLLLWSFVGVAIVSDCFMAAIETITSQTYTIKQDTFGVTRRFRVRVWNSTVANLTLMALGSSAPEILLSVIELLSNDCFSGELGPSTIVGSAAFNLLIIIAVCVMAIPAHDGRKIADMRVHAVTATFSIWAYLWLIVILMMSSPDIIDVWEAVVTFLMFPLLVLLAFYADKWKDDGWRRKHPFLKHIASPAQDKSELPSAFLLDVKNPDGSPLSPRELVHMVKQLKRSHFEGMSDEQAAKIIHDQMVARQPKSRAYYRVAATRLMTATPTTVGRLKHDMRGSMAKMADVMRRLPSRVSPTTNTRSPTDVVVELANSPSSSDLVPHHPTVGFAHDTYAVIESAGTVTLQLLRQGPADFPLAVAYESHDDTAIAPEDYIAVAGVIEFAAGQLTAELAITIIDDDIEEPDEHFTVSLHEPSGGGTQLDEVTTVTRVTIINDDFPGTFHLPSEDIVVRDSEKEVHIPVHRVNGCSGTVSLAYRTFGGTAVDGKDYSATAGQLMWEHGDVTPQTVVVPLVDDDESDGAPAGEKRYFEVEISQATGGAEFDSSTDGSSERSIARVTMCGDDTVRSIVDKVVGMVGFNQAAVRLGAGTWSEQFASALAVGGDDDGEEDAGPPTLMTYASHYIALPWKLLFATIPPTAFCGGYLAFFCSLAYIGVLTAFIGDIANLFGCVLGIKPSVVAITFVALGTSLPDTFASRAAALGDVTADAAVGNVTGSNAVNVFLGLGLSWLFGALRWSGGANAEWLRRYPDIAARYDVKLGDSVGLPVPAGNLGSSVSVFCVCALLCLATLQFRRVKFGNELGGPGRLPTACFFCGLWLLYIVASTIIAYSTD